MRAGMTNRIVAGHNAYERLLITVKRVYDFLIIFNKRGGIPLPLKPKGAKEVVGSKRKSHPRRA